MAEELNDKKPAGTIDLTPTWAQMLPTMLAVITGSDNLASVNNMTDELRKMAMLADERNAMIEQGFPPEAVRNLSDLEAHYIATALHVAATILGDPEVVHESLLDVPRIAAGLEAMATMVEG